MFNSIGPYCGGLLNFGRFQYGGLAMFIIGAILIGIVIYFIVRKDDRSNKDSVESPIDLLKKRFVNGDISKEEYLSKKEVLGK